MATSGEYIYNVTAGDIIEEALGLVGVYSPGEAVDASESADALRTLNMMLKAWQSKRIGLWLQKELSLILQKTTASYNIGPTGDHCSSSVIKTELATAAASGASSITIDSISGMGDTFDRNGLVTATTPTGAGTVTLSGALVSSGIATMSSQRNILVYSDADDSGVAFGITGLNALGVAVTETLTGPNTTTVYSANTYKTISSITIDGAGTGNIEIGQVGDHIGIELTSGSMQWTNVGAAASTTTTLITTLTGAAAVDNHVYTYTTKPPRPIDIIEVRIKYSDGNETSLGPVMSLQDYMGFTNKTNAGAPNQVYYDPQLTNGVLKTWPVCDDVKEYLKFTARLPIQIMSGLTDDFEVSAEFFEAIAWNLAIRLYPKYEKKIDPMVRDMARVMLEEAEDLSREYASSFIQIVGY